MPLTKHSAHNGTVLVTWLLPAAPESAWKGLTDPAMLAQWLGQPLECDLRPGGQLVIDHGEGFLSRSIVAEANPPHRLAMTWTFPEEPESHVTFTLSPGPSGSSLELVHRQLGSLSADYGPGWITHLTYLEAAIAGRPLDMAHFWRLHSTFTVLSAGK